MSHPVFDYSAGMPWLINNKLDKYIEELIEEEPVAATEQFRDRKIRELRTNPEYGKKLRDAYDSAGVNLSSVTMFGRDNSQKYMGSKQVQRAINRWTARFDTLDWLHKVTSPDQARRIAGDEEVGIIMNVQDLGAVVDEDVDQVERLYNQGVRIMQLTYNRQNSLGAGCTERSDGGLSHRGIDVVDRMNKLGSIIDLSHCGKYTTLDAISESEDPTAFTHAFCSEVADHDRGKSDEEMKLLAETDGYMGILSLRFFIGAGIEDPSFELFFKHLEHAISIMGIDNIGIGSDFSEIHDINYPSKLRQDDSHDEAGWRKEHGISEQGHFNRFKRFTDWSVISDGLHSRYTDHEVEKILGENFLNYWERVE